jgi:hypothetical protein
VRYKIWEAPDFSGIWFAETRDGDCSWRMLQSRRSHRAALIAAQVIAMRVHMQVPIWS